MGLISFFTHRRQEVQTPTRTNETENTQEVQNRQLPAPRYATNPNNSLERNPQEDSFSLGDDSREHAKSMIKGLSMLYVAGFCMGFCPGLFFLAAGAFLFSNKGQSFMDKMAESIANNQNALNQLNARMMGGMNPQAQPTNNAQPANNGPAPANNNNNATNPIAETQETTAPEEQPLTPLQMAQERLTRTQDVMTKREALLRRDEAALREKQAKLEACQTKIENCNPETQKYQDLCDQRDRLQSGILTLEQRVAERQARFDKAVIDNTMAQRHLADLQAEEIVDVD